MQKYIKAEALIDDLRGLAEANKGTYHEEGFKNAITVVEMQDSADVVDKERYANLLANSIIVCEALKKYQSADMVERKDLDEITEAHEQIGYEKGYQDGYASALADMERDEDVTN